MAPRSTTAPTEPGFCPHTVALPVCTCINNDDRCLLFEHLLCASDTGPAPLRSILYRPRDLL